MNPQRAILVLQLPADGFLTPTDKVVVDAVLFHQFIVCAALHDAPLVEHADLVGILDGREAVGHGDGRACLHQSEEGVLHQSLALGVEGRGGLVEDEHGRVL